MNTLITSALLGLILTNLVLLGSSHLRMRIRVLAAQGIILGFLTAFAQADVLSLHVVLLALGIILIKGVFFPVFFRRLARDAAERHEFKPYVSYSASVAAGIGLLFISFWIAAKLPLPGPVASPLALPTALVTILSGFLVVIARRKAVNQVLGYLAAENGIYAFGAALVGEGPLLVELAMLLDLLVAVFIMGIAINHLRNEFDAIVDTAAISELKD